MTTLTFQTQAEQLSKLKAMLDEYETYFFGTNYDPFKDYQIYFITINTKTTTTGVFFSPIKDTYHRIEKKISSKRLKNCYTYYTHEFYTTQGSHFHTHILLFKLKTDKRLGKKSFIEYFYDKKLMNSKSSIDIKQVMSQQSLTIRMNYIGGIKQQCKNPNTIKDNELKCNLGIPLTTKHAYDLTKHKMLKRFLLDK